MKVGRHFRPVDLARAAGVSAATVRMYEREGFLPPAERRASGHRQYREAHLRALLASRALMRGYGWEYARRVMRAVHDGNVAEVVALVDARHADLHRSRQEVDATVQALQVFAEGSKPAQADGAPSHVAPMRVGSAARWAGVPMSSLRFWEEQGLLHPRREPRSNYRVYASGDLEQLRIVVVLRKAGYGFEEIRRVLHQLGKNDPAAALAEVQKRQHELAEASRSCMAATAALWRYLSEITGVAGSTHVGDVTLD